MEEKKFDLSQLYIIDFAKNLFRKKNALAVVYLAINVLIITLMMQMFEPNIWLCLLYGILLYALTATVALSPLGEWIFRHLNGCKQIEDPAIVQRLQPLFDSYAKGWIAGDCHQHTFYSDGVDPVEDVMIGNAANGVYFGFLTDHNTSRGVPASSTRPSDTVDSSSVNFAFSFSASMATALPVLPYTEVYAITMPSCSGR